MDSVLRISGGPDGDEAMKTFVGLIGEGVSHYIGIELVLAAGSPDKP